jgi:predicted CopG family antitoxin
MSHINFDFLTESFLFGSGLNDKFSSLSDCELEKELNRYREYVLSNMVEICKEIISDSKKIAVTIESFSERPSEELLKQLALYVDVIAISDPLFELTEKKSTSTKVMSEYYGMDSDETIDREKLVEALKYMKESTMLIVCNYVKYIPISYLHEAPLNVPITYDANNYSKSLPEPIMEFLKKNIQIHNTVVRDRGLCVEFDKPLTKGTGLFIHFPDCGFRNGEIVQYQESEVVHFDKKTGRATLRFFTPDIISQETFSIWLEQSVNKACLHMYNETFQEMYLASRLNTMYLTQSALKAQMMSIEMGKQSVDTKITNMALQLDVPVFENSKISDIISIRNNYGESFANFRSELGEKLLHLSHIVDDEQLANELQEVTYAINETYINQINRETRSLIRSLGIEATIATGSLITNNMMSGNNMLSLIAASIAAIGGIKDTVKLFGDVRERPGYFLWKLNKENKR